MQEDDTLQQTGTGRRIGGGRPAIGQNPGHTDTLVLNPKAGLQMRHLIATNASLANVTFHSNSSGKQVVYRCLRASAYLSKMAEVCCRAACMMQ